MFRRISKGEELPGFQEDGEYSERAFEAWLREQAIMPAQVFSEDTVTLGSSHQAFVWMHFLRIPLIRAAWGREQAECSTA